MKKNIYHMNSIYLIIDKYTNGYIGEFLDILSLISIIFGLLILISKNPTGFFLQAEDGIRDATVTGVQTGALPISEPGGKIAPLGKGSPIANCRYHCAGDDRSDARNGHQLPTGLTVAGQEFDLLCHVFDTLIETAPVAAEVLDNPDHSWR